MLDFPPYYWRTIRKCVQAFGSLFDNMVLVKYDNTTQQEISRLTVPLIYSGKENFITRLLDNPNLAKPVEITLPRAGFEITGYQYASARKFNTFNSTTVPNVNGSVSQQYQSVPWDIDFDLSIYVRNVEDGTQLVEQILPVFTPDYTLTINYIPELGIVRNAPIILNSCQCSTEYQGNEETERVIIWTLGFTLQAQFFGPIITGNVITQVNNNIFINTTLGDDGLASDVQITVQANTGNGNYQLNEIVYQGGNLPDATATGQVSTWDNAANAGQLVLANVQGTFVTGEYIIGSQTGTSYLANATADFINMAAITITPSPNTANLNSDYGWSINIIEYPKTV